MHLFQLERGAPPHIVPDVFFVDENLMDSALCPRTGKIGEDSAGIQDVGNFLLGAASRREVVVNFPDHRDFRLWTRDKDDPVGGDTFLLAARQFTLWFPSLVHQDSAKTIAGRASLSISKPDQVCLSRVNLYRQLAAVFSGHCPLDRLDDRGTDAAVVLELLRAVVNKDSHPLAPKLDFSCFVGILKTSPAADVIHQDSCIVGATAFDIVEQGLKGVTADEPQATLAFVGIGPDDLVASFLRVASDHCGLVVRGVFLMLGRHADVFRCPDFRRVLLGSVTAPLAPVDHHFWPLDSVLSRLADRECKARRPERCFRRKAQLFRRTVASREASMPLRSPRR